jgi:hypothetical protein
MGAVFGTLAGDLLFMLGAVLGLAAERGQKGSKRGQSVVLTDFCGSGRIFECHAS